MVNIYGLNIFTGLITIVSFLWLLMRIIIDKSTNRSPKDDWQAIIALIVFIITLISTIAIFLI